MDFVSCWSSCIVGMAKHIMIWWMKPHYTSLYILIYGAAPMPLQHISTASGPWQWNQWRAWVAAQTGIREGHGRAWRWFFWSISFGGKFATCVRTSKLSTTGHIVWVCAMFPSICHNLSNYWFAKIPEPSSTIRTKIWVCLGFITIWLLACLMLPTKTSSTTDHEFPTT